MINKKYIFGFIGIMVFLVILMSILQYLNMFLTQGQINLLIVSMILVGVGVIVFTFD